MARKTADATAGSLSRRVRIWDIRVNEGRPNMTGSAKKSRKTYTVRWVVQTKEFQTTYATRALAEAERAALLAYTNRGEAFDTATGQPESKIRERARVTWYDHMCRYVDTKWPYVSGNSRRSIADALATATPAFAVGERGRPSTEALRELVYAWLANAPRRAVGDPPAHLAGSAAWLARNSVDLARLADRASGSALVRQALTLLATTLGGKPAAPNTVARKKAVLFNVFEYGVELGILSVNPLTQVSWRPPKNTDEVDPQVVINSDQGWRLLFAVAEQGLMGRRLVAFFALMLLAALRPAEALWVRDVNLVSLPMSGWGELLLRRSYPRSGTAWTDCGTSREERSLKHRSAKETRPVPLHPDLVALIKEHIDEFGYGPGGRLFTGPRGGQIDESTYLRIWNTARLAALTPGELALGLADRPYDLRHTAVSSWLNAGVPPTQVAEWAGHSVAVLHKVYAKCVVGSDQAARDRIEKAMPPRDQDKRPSIGGRNSPRIPRDEP